MEHSDLKVIYDTLGRAQHVLKNGINDLSDCFSDYARFIITPSNKCNSGCYHCVAESTPFGEIMDYDKFSKINPDFFKVFQIVDFGRKGNPLNYMSNKYDLADILNILYKNGIKSFTIAPAINSRPSIYRRIAKFKSERDISIETMLTYHHYFDPLDTQKLADDFNFAIKNKNNFLKK